ncbi:hypothetical protein Lepto7375DRAFT_0195 [Leptolyngbya sp. PCC 7375]|nr:hypothetical protein Lepto7375DRAFT_0195 [Leptolyngbya sp. PCC 7375]
MTILQSRQSMITKTSVLWINFVITILLTLAFLLIAGHWDFIFIDAVASPANVRALLEQMSVTQKTIHAWSTATLDVVYPFAYGSLFAGVALRFFSKYGVYLALPALLAIPVDLIEGVIQVLALTETADVLELKAYITPLKFGLFIIGFIVALAGWAKWLFLRLKT